MSLGLANGVMSAFLGEIGVQVSKITKYGYTGWSDILNIWTSHDGFHTTHVCTVYWTKKDYVAVEVYGDSEDVGAFFEALLMSRFHKLPLGWCHHFRHKILSSKAVLRRKNINKRPNNGGLAHAWAAGNDRHLVGQGRI